MQPDHATGQPIALTRTTPFLVGLPDISDEQNDSLPVAAADQTGQSFRHVVSCPNTPRRREPGDIFRMVSLMRIIVISVIAMLLQQALATMAPLTMAVIGPVVVDFLDLNPGYIGAFVAMTYGTSMVSSLMAGGAIARYGAVRVSQCALLFCGLGLAVAALGSLPLFILAAVLLGLGGGPSTPASSHILARFSPPHILPLVFSIKQTGVPVGGILAGALIPFWLGLVGWQGALLLATALLWVSVLMLQPLRGMLDDDRDPGRALSLRGSAGTFRSVLRNPALREIAMAHFLFTGLQLTYGSFFVAFLVDGNGQDLVFAGLAFACGQGAGIFGRIFWGWVASGRTAPRLILGMLGLGMGLVGCVFALMSPDWSSWAIIATSIAFGLTGMSFQGVLLSEIARRAPEGSVGDVTGVVVVFAYAGMVIFPGAVGAIVGVTGSYAAGFVFSAVATMPISILLLRKSPR